MCDNLQPWQLRQPVDERFAEAIGHVVLLGIVAAVPQRQDRDRRDARVCCSVARVDDITGHEGRQDHQHKRRPDAARPSLPTMGRSRLLNVASFQGRDDVAGTGEPLFRATCETSQNRGFPKRIHVRHVDARARRWLVQAFDRHLERGFSHKGQRSCQHLVQHDAERVDIRRGCDRAALNLLGRHIGRCARDLTLRRPIDVDIDRLVQSSCALRDARPKSVTTARTCPSARVGFTSMTLWLLKSRCTTPTRCAAVRPSAI